MAEFSELVRIKKRMCDKFSRNSCNGCPLSQNGCEIIFIIGYSDFDFKKLEETLLSWAAEQPEQVYPTWAEYISEQIIHDMCKGEISGPETVLTYAMYKPIPADIAQKLGVEPKEG